MADYPSRAYTYIVLLCQLQFGRTDIFRGTVSGTWRLLLGHLLGTGWLICRGTMSSLVSREEIISDKSLATIGKLAGVNFFWPMVELVAVQVFRT